MEGERSRAKVKNNMKVYIELKKKKKIAEMMTKMYCQIYTGGYDLN